jgi:hypothetical protein
VKRFDLLNEQVETFVDGARKIKRYKDGYAAIMAQNQLALVNANGVITKQTDIVIPIYVNTNWLMIDGFVYYTSQDQEEINFHRVALETGEEVIKPLGQGSYNSRFSMTRNGAKLVRMVMPTFSNTILNANLMMGE